MRQKLAWKLTASTAAILSVGLLGERAWFRQVYIFRWLWQARLAVLAHRLCRLGSAEAFKAEIERYRPGANIVALAPRRVASGRRGSSQVVTEHFLT